MTRSAIRVAIVAALVLTVLSGTHRASAQAQDEATRQARVHYQKGMVYFQNGDYPNAVGELKQAYQIKHIPALLFNIGQTYRKMDDAALAIFYFEKFLKEAPRNAPQRGEAEKILAELRTKKNQGQIAVPPPLDEAPPQGAPQIAPQPRRRMVDKFEHKEVDEAPPQTPLDVRLMLPELEGARATLYYRTAGHDTYTAVPMHHRYDEWVGRVPGEMIIGKSFQYYLEARDASGNIIGKSGSAGAPNIVSIVEGAKSQFYADLSEGMEGQTAEQVQAMPAPQRATRPWRRHSDEDEAGFEHAKPRTLHNFRTLKWTAASVAGGAILVGLVSGIIAMSNSSDVEGNACTPTQQQNCIGTGPNQFFNEARQSSQSTGQAFSTISALSLIVGALTAGGAIALFVLDDSAEMEPEKRSGKPHRGLSLGPVVAPTPGGTVFGFTGGFHF
jgi:hypothetical protein